MNIPICLALALMTLVAPGQAVIPAVAEPAHKDAAFTEFFRQTKGWAAGDVGVSIPLADGRVLWLFGDSYVDEKFDPAKRTLPKMFDAHNALMLQSPDDLAHPQTLANSSLPDKSFFRLQSVPADQFWPCLWPGTGFQSGNTLYVYLKEIDQTPQKGMWGFKAIGQYWAKVALPEFKVTGYVKLPAFNDIYFWDGFINDPKAGLTYAYGAKNRGMFGELYVARFPTKDPEGEWSFWDGKDWTSQAENAAVIGKGASFSMNVCKAKGKYLLTSSELSVACDQGKRIYISASDSPTGPFPPGKVIFTVDDVVKGHYPLFYGPVGHPEFINADNELLITYCINGYEPKLPFGAKGQMKPDYYRPRAIRLPLSWVEREF